MEVSIAQPHCLALQPYHVLLPALFADNSQHGDNFFPFEGSSTFHIVLDLNSGVGIPLDYGLVAEVA